jgi:hypothetical protein
MNVRVPMSEPIPRGFHDEVFFPLAWWMLAAVVEEIAGEVIERRAIEPIGVRLAVRGRGEMTLIGDDERCEVAYSGDWQDLHQRLDRIVRSAEVYRRQMWKLNVDDAIERWYRSRARGSKLTLKDVAEMTGFSYSYVTKAKMEYDRRGGWGSKRATERSVKDRT